MSGMTEIAYRKCFGEPVLKYDNCEPFMIHTTSEDGTYLEPVARINPAEYGKFFNVFMKRDGYFMVSTPREFIYFNVHQYVYDITFSGDFKADENDCEKCLMHICWRPEVSPLESGKEITIQIDAEDKDGIIDQITSRLLDSGNRVRLTAEDSSKAGDTMGIPVNMYSDEWVAMTYNYEKALVTVIRPAKWTYSEDDEKNTTTSPHYFFGDRFVSVDTQTLSVDAWNDFMNNEACFDGPGLRVNGRTTTVFNTGYYDMSVKIATTNTLEFTAYPTCSDAEYYPATDAVCFVLPIDDTPWNRVARAVDYLVASGAMTYRIDPPKECE